MFLLSLTATCQVYTVSLKAGLYTYNRSARRTLDTPDGETTQADTGVMGVAGQAPATATGRLVGELKAEGQDEGEDTFEERFAIAKELEVRRFILKIHSNSPVFTGLAGGVLHGSSSGQRVGAADDPQWRNTGTISRRSRRAEVPHH
jgi:hypothetical protein